MKTETILKLLDAIEAGKIRSEKDCTVLRISRSAFWRRVAEAKKLGVVIETNGLGSVRPGARPEPWRVRDYGLFKKKARKTLASWVSVPQKEARKETKK